jgi:hypothetical protein
VVHGREHEIIEIPAVGFEAFQEIAAPPPSECCTALCM